MAKEVSALKVRGSLGELLEEVYYRGEEFVVKRGKKPMAVLVPVEEFECFKRQREKDMAIFAMIRENAPGKTMEEVEKELIQQALSITGGNQSKAAKKLSLGIDAFRYRMKKFGLLE